MSARSRAGFTLVELMIASLIFSMIVAGLAAIYSTAFSQAGRVIIETRTQASATEVARAIEREVSQATRLDEPARGAGGDVLRGDWHMATDGTNVGAMVGRVPRTFVFCVQPNCTTPPPVGPDPPRCVFYYSYPNYVANPGVTAGTCGAQALGVTPDQLAAGVSQVPGLPFFSRIAGDAGGQNGVRAAMMVNKTSKRNEGAALQAGKSDVSYQVDVSVLAQFNGDSGP